MLDREELLEQVEALLSEGEPERAWMLCKRGLRRFPMDAELWLCMGDSAFDSDRLEEADRAFRKAAQIDRELATPWARLAEVRLVQGKLPSARELAEKAHEMDKDLGHASFILAICCELEGRAEEARFWYHRAQKLNSTLYFLPLKISEERFRLELDLVIEQLREEVMYERAIANTRWTIVTPGNPVPDGCPPMRFCHLASRRDRRGEVIVRQGWLLMHNVLRECRVEADLLPQLYGVLMDELDIAVGAGFDEPPF